METFNNFVNTLIASYAGWWQWIAQIYVPVLIGFFT